MQQFPTFYLLSLTFIFHIRIKRDIVVGVRIVFVADCDSELVAYAGAVIRDYPPVFTLKKFGCIEEIAVSLGHRRKGIAGQLFEAAEEWLLSRNVDRIEVSIDCANDASLGFFRDHGFQDHVVRLIREY